MIVYTTLLFQPFCTELFYLMKFSVSTLFFLITIAALTLGWLFERTSRLAAEESHLEKRQLQKFANRSIGAAIEAASLVEMLRESPGGQETLVMDSVLVQHVCETWQDHKLISDTLDETHCSGMTSHALAAILLRSLGCKTPEDFHDKYANAVSSEMPYTTNGSSDVGSADFDLYLKKSIEIGW